MDVNIRDIGNSKGIIIPQSFLKESGIKDMASLSMKGSQSIIQPYKKARIGWAEAIKQDPPQENEPIFMDQVTDDSLLNEWTW